MLFYLILSYHHHHRHRHCIAYVTLIFNMLLFCYFVGPFWTCVVFALKKYLSWGSSLNFAAIFTEMGIYFRRSLQNSYKTCVQRFYHLFILY